MKYLAALLLIVSFAGTGIFGLTLLDHGMMGASSGDCVASSIDGTVCPTSIVGMTLHHISALQTLMATIVPASNWLLLLASLLLLIAALLLLSFCRNVLHEKLEPLRERLRDFAFAALYSRQKVTSWLSLFENSPAF